MGRPKQRLLARDARRLLSVAEPDPKPTPRVRLSRFRYQQQTRALLDATQRCECLCGRRCEEVHHALSGSSREDVPEAWLCLARVCHAAFTTKQRTFDLERGVYVDPQVVAQGLRERMETARPEVLAYIIDRKGAEFLDRVYPRGNDSGPP